MQSQAKEEQGIQIKVLEDETGQVEDEGLEGQQERLIQGPGISSYRRRTLSISSLRHKRAGSKQDEQEAISRQKEETAKNGARPSDRSVLEGRHVSFTEAKQSATSTLPTIEVQSWYSQCWKNPRRCAIIVSITLTIILIIAVIIWKVHASGNECRCCPNRWTMFDTTCYFVSKNTSVWKSAQEYCDAEGGALLTLNETIEQQVIQLFTLQFDHWIGLRKDPPPGTWKWVNGSVYRGSVNYDGSHQDCAYISITKDNSVVIGALDCSTARPWICMKTLH